MSVSQQKPAYKVISLFIKAIILIFSFLYIWQKFSEANESIDFVSLFSGAGPLYLFLVILMIGLNWGLEALKWSVLISSLERISFSCSLQSVFAGVTISIFSPNRIGEFAGRIFFLEKADKVEASLRSFCGSMMQLLITLLAGIIALLAYLRSGFADQRIFTALGDTGLRAWAVLTLILGVLLLFAYRMRKRFPAKVQRWLNAFFGLSRKEISVSLLLSLARYAVYSVQYYLVLLLFNIDAGFLISLMFISLTFLVTSAIPTFAFTEITVRGATAVYFFSSAGAPAASVVAASLLLWLLNLGLPALTGGIFIWKLKFFKT